MKIAIMRHGQASFDVPSDNERPLTEAGIEQNRSNLQALQKQLQDVQLFLSSPLLRAQQTAKIAQQELGFNGKTETVAWITPDVSPDKALIHLSRYSQQFIMLFSHNPFSSAFVDLLCGHDSGFTMMQTSGIVIIEADPVAADFGRLLYQQR